MSVPSDKLMELMRGPRSGGGGGGAGGAWDRPGSKGGSGLIILRYAV